MMKTRMILATAAAAALTLAACGDDDDTASEATTVAPATTEAPATTAPATTAAPATEAPATTTADADSTTEATATGDASDPYCALVLEMYNQETPPTAEQLTQYQEIAPAGIQDAVAIAAAPLAAAGEDMVAFFTVFAQDDVEQAIAQIDAFENETCGTEHDDTTPPEGASRDIEAEATRVDVVASDYAFDMPDTVGAGRASFVLTNEGHETHVLVLVKLAEGATLAEAMETEDDSMIEGFWETGYAAPDGEDEEVITFDLEPGNYGALCFVPGPDGTPHFLMGMQKEFTVS